MIKKIHVEGLKSVRNVTVNCSKLNLFVGTNSSGKSTFLQSLLLWKQGSLNGKYIDIGDFREVRNYNISKGSIRIEVEGKKEEYIEFIESDKKEGYKIESSLTDIHSVMQDLDWREYYDNCEDEVDFYLDEYFHYLSCHRIGARDIYAKNILEDRGFGIDGEYALAYLLKNESKKIKKNLLKDTEKTTDSLLGQVNYWLDYIVNTTLSISDIKKTNYLQVKYNNNPKNINSDALYCRATNIGSGISYLISVIIACLGAEIGSVNIIENPEIHLHPKAQSKLCEFFCFVSKGGQQLFIESHSDHIFNGLRVGVSNGSVLNSDISVNFFALNENFETQCNPIEFKEYGKIVGTNDEMDINDLFDQFEIDLDRMLGLEV